MTATPSAIAEPPPQQAPADVPVERAASSAAQRRPDESAPATPSLTDFLDLETLQEIQDTFTGVTRLATTILDADGRQLTRDTDPDRRAESDDVLTQLIEADDANADRLVAPITIAEQQVGSIVVHRRAIRPLQGITRQQREQMRQLGERLQIDSESLETLLTAAETTFAPSAAASIQLLYQMANGLAQLCYEQHQSQQRLDELEVLYKLTGVLSGSTDLQATLDTAARAVAEVMQVKAVNIRLLQHREGEQELVPVATHGLSEAYLNKGRLLVNRSELYSKALDGEVVYIEDMAADPRVFFPQDAEREGLKSMLAVGMIFQDRPIGTLQVASPLARRFSRFERQMVRGIAQLLATAISNKRLDEKRAESQQIQRQVQLASSVQRRMLPRTPPRVDGYQIAARYVPSFELGGDFYDFIDLDGATGIGIGDVVGKGVPAALLMASVRASLRAFAQDVYDLDEVIGRVNHNLCRDTLDNEFATLWYGSLDHATLRLTYCNAGHEPALLLRGGRVIELDTGGMIVGIDPDQPYEKGIWDFEPGDTMVLYTDGLPDGLHHSGEGRFGRDRIVRALAEANGRSAQETMQHLLNQHRAFTGGKRGVDDLTLVVFRCTHRPMANHPMI